jgi:GAF domain-containing protein
MDDVNQSDKLTAPANVSEQSEPLVAKTRELPRDLPDIAAKDRETVQENNVAAKDEAAFQAGQEKVLEMIEQRAPLGEILTTLVLLMEAQSPDMLCSVLLLSDDGDHIRHGAAPSLPKDFVKAIDGEPIGPKNGSCGTAMWRGKPVIVTDVLTDPLWDDYRDLATASGLGACWSTPILSGKGKVLGSFAMYYREPRAPTGAEARFTEVATQLAGEAIEKQATREHI